MVHLSCLKKFGFYNYVTWNPGTGLIWAGIALGRKGFLSSPVAFHCPGRLANQEDRFTVGFQVLVSLFG